MLNYLSNGPSLVADPRPPAWIPWRLGDAAELATASDHSPQSDDSTSCEDSDFEVDGPFVPFLANPVNKDGKKCRCGSSTHLTVNHLACPLNPKRSRADDDSDTQPASARARIADSESDTEGDTEGDTGIHPCVRVGARVEVFWQHYDDWFVGKVMEIDLEDSSFYVTYEADGHEVWHGSEWQVRPVQQPE